MGLTTDVFFQLAYALGIGLLIGLERSMDQELPQSAPPNEADEPGADDETSLDAADRADGVESKATAADGSASELLGIRTFGVLSLLGYAASLAAEHFPLVAPVALGAAAILVIVMYKRASSFGVGITTEAAAIAACALGMLCRHQAELAAVIALVVTSLLASKRFARSTARKMRRVELTDTLKFLVVVLIVIPLLPNRDLDPFGVFNPAIVGVLVVLVSGISFVGYFLTRILGAQRGLALTGVLGGLTSSTAVTAAMAVEAKQTPALRTICAFSTIAANATMFGRVLVVVAVLDRPLVYKLVWPIGSMAIAAAVAAVVLWLMAGKASQRQEVRSDVKLKNPFSLVPALKFAAFFVAVLVVSKVAVASFGDSGLFIAAALSGLADVDAITLSVAEQSSEGSLARGVGAVAVTIAVVSNSLVKSGIALTSGGFKFGRLVALCLGIATGVGLVVAFTLA